jgi:hypothetical protein
MAPPNLYERLGGVSSIGTVIDDFVDRIMVDDLGEGLIGNFWLATDAYIYGYPLVTMEMTRRYARAHHRHRPWREPTTGRGLSDLTKGREPRRLSRVKQLCPGFCQRQAATREGFLVSHHV